MTKTSDSETVDYMVFNYNSENELESYTIPTESQTNYYATPYSPFPPGYGLLASSQQLNDGSTPVNDYSIAGILAENTTTPDLASCVGLCQAAWNQGKTDALNAATIASAAAAGASIAGLVACFASTLAFPLCSAAVMAILAIAIAAIMAVYINQLSALEVTYQACKADCIAQYGGHGPAFPHLAYPDPSDDD